MIHVGNMAVVSLATAFAKDKDEPLQYAHVHGIRPR